MISEIKQFPYSDNVSSLSLVSHNASRPSVEVFEGAESVKLPCQVPVSVSVGSTSVWDRDDFRIPTVHVRQPDGDYLKDQNHRFEGRTSMMEDALQTGDLTLTLRRPTFTDSGTFTCTVRRLGEDLHQEDVELQVKSQCSRVSGCTESISTCLDPVCLHDVCRSSSSSLALGSGGSGSSGCGSCCLVLQI